LFSTEQKHLTLEEQAAEKVAGLNSKIEELKDKVEDLEEFK